MRSAGCGRPPRAERELACDLERRGLTAEPSAQVALDPDDLVELLDHVHRHADGARLVRERARDGLPDPPGGVRRELEALAVVELLRCADEADRALLDEVEERQPLVAVALGDRDDQAQVRLHHLALRVHVAALDPLRQLDLLRGGQQLHLADVLQEELQRVGRDLTDRCDRLVVLLDVASDDVDVHLLERAVEVVDRARVDRRGRPARRRSRRRSPCRPARPTRSTPSPRPSRAGP